VGDFDLAMLWTAGNSPSTPWLRFRDMLDPRDVPPIGDPASWNFGRFIDPDVPALLDLAGQAEDPITVKDVYDQLDKIFMDNAVDIPLMYRPVDFYEFNTTHWRGFPTEDDPSAPPTFQGAGIQLLYQISPVQTLFLPVVKR
jgi:peptide/nickel transport system substrate-binding protein